MTDAPPTHGRKQVSLTENADYVSTSALVRAILSFVRNSLHSLLVYGFVGVVQNIDDLPGLSGVGVWCYLLFW
jgi:hypothetical protein